jgi:ABC-type multidrug transport system fused ATPase/permease subunit
VTSGSIAVDGIDIRDLRVAEYRRRIAVVSQDIEIFDKTIAENIAYGTPASREEIEQVARAAYAHDFISRFPEGYDTRVGEKGVKLSGGQRQRIGIARALLMKPMLLIFDEATSSLDTESEKMIQEALIAISHRQTMIIIAHRLSTIKSADLIVVFNEGSVEEVGSHEELMKKGGLFAHMENLQLLGELRD